MKKCTNCGTLNTAEAIQCKSCNMKNNMIVIATSNNKQVELAQHSCRNCGKYTSINNNKCTFCNFPIKKSQDYKPQNNIRKLRIG